MQQANGAACRMQARADMHQELAEATLAVQDVVTLVRKQAMQIKQEAASSHAAITAARKQLQAAFAEHCTACRCGRSLHVLVCSLRQCAPCMHARMVRSSWPLVGEPQLAGASVPGPAHHLS